MIGLESSLVSKSVEIVVTIIQRAMSHLEKTKNSHLEKTKISHFNLSHFQG